MCARAGNYSVYTAVRDSFANGSSAWRAGRVGDFHIDPRSHKLPVRLLPTRSAASRRVPPLRSHVAAGRSLIRLNGAARREGEAFEALELSRMCTRRRAENSCANSVSSDSVRVECEQ